eukprot:PhF_6_TR11661/c3_g1_i1/m.18828
MTEAAVTSETLLRAHELRARDEELRRKDKEIQKKEQQLKARQDEADKQRSDLDKLSIALEARENAIAELERRHGTLAEHEQVLMNRERQMEVREAEYIDKLNALETKKLEHEAFFQVKAERIRRSDVSCSSKGARASKEGGRDRSVACRYRGPAQRSHATHRITRIMVSNTRKHRERC